MPTSRRATCKTTSTSLLSALTGQWTVHLNLLHPSSALSLRLNPLSTPLTLWHLARKPFDDVHGQEGVGNGQEQAGRKIGARPGHGWETRDSTPATSRQSRLLECRDLTPARMPSYLQIRNVASCRLCLHLPSQFLFLATCQHPDFVNISSTFPVNKSFLQHLTSLPAEYHQEHNFRYCWFPCKVQV